MFAFFNTYFLFSDYYTDTNKQFYICAANYFNNSDQKEKKNSKQFD